MFDLHLILLLDAVSYEEKNNTKLSIAEKLYRQNEFSPP